MKRIISILKVSPGRAARRVTWEDTYKYLEMLKKWKLLQVAYPQRAAWCTFKIPKPLFVHQQSPKWQIVMEQQHKSNSGLSRTEA